MSINVYKGYHCLLSVRYKELLRSFLETPGSLTPVYLSIYLSICAVYQRLSIYLCIFWSRLSIHPSIQAFIYSQFQLLTIKIILSQIGIHFILNFQINKDNLKLEHSSVLRVYVVGRYYIHCVIFLNIAHSKNTTKKYSVSVNTHILFQATAQLLLEKTAIFGSLYKNNCKMP